VHIPTPFQRLKAVVSYLVLSSVARLSGIEEAPGLSSYAIHSAKLDMRCAMIYKSFFGFTNWQKY